MALFVLADIAIKLGKFLLLPILLFFLSPSEFGQVEYYLSFAAFFSSFLGPGLQNWLIRNGRSKLDEVFHSTLILYLQWFSLIFVLVLIVSLYQSDYYLLLLLFYSLSNSLYLFLLAYIKIIQKFKAYAVSAAILVVFDILLITALLASDVGFSSRFIGATIASIVAILSTAALIKLRLKNEYLAHQSSSFGSTIKFFFPFILMGLSGFFTTSYSKILVAGSDGFERLASLGLALQLLSIFKLSSDALVKTISSIFLPSDYTEEAALMRFYTFSFFFIALGYLFLLFLSLVNNHIVLTHYPSVLDDLFHFSPSRILMVLNLYASILVTSLIGSNTLIFVACITLLSYLIGLPIVLELGGVRYIAKFDFIYNFVVLCVYSSVLLYTLKLKQKCKYILGLILMLMPTYGFYTLL